MPETRLEKARASLPSGYQYGDAAPTIWDHVDGWMAAIGAQSIVREFDLVTQYDGTTEQIPRPQVFQCR